MLLLLYTCILHAWCPFKTAPFISIRFHYRTTHISNKHTKKNNQIKYIIHKTYTKWHRERKRWRNSRKIKKLDLVFFQLMRHSTCTLIHQIWVHFLKRAVFWVNLHLNFDHFILSMYISIYHQFSLPKFSPYM